MDGRAGTGVTPITILSTRSVRNPRVDGTDDGWAWDIEGCNSDRAEFISRSYTYSTRKMSDPSSRPRFPFPYKYI